MDRKGFLLRMGFFFLLKSKMQFLSPVPPPCVGGGGEAPADRADHADHADQRQHAKHSNHRLLSLHFPCQLQTEELGILRPLCRFSNVLRHLGQHDSSRVACRRRQSVRALCCPVCAMPRFMFIDIPALVSFSYVDHILE